jgi:hypothetical protein
MLKYHHMGKMLCLLLKFVEITTPLLLLDPSCEDIQEQVVRKSLFLSYASKKANINYWLPAIAAVL